MPASDTENPHSLHALAARQAAVTGGEQRIAPLAPEDMSEASLAIIHDIRAAAGAGPMGDIPGYFRTMAHHPDIFRCQLDMGAVLFRGRLPARTRELAVLRLAWRVRAPYEWGEHSRIASRFALSAEDVARVRQGPAAPGWSAHEAAVLRGVDELLADQFISGETWAVLAASWDKAQLIEFPMMVGQYLATAFVQNSLRVALEPDNAGFAP